MTFGKSDNSSKFYKITFILALALLLFTSAIFYKQHQKQGESSEWITHTLNVSKEIQKLSVLFSEIYTKNLENFVGSDEIAVQSINSLEKTVKSSINQIRNLTLDNPVQQENIRRLSELNQRLVDNTRVSPNVETLSKLSRNVSQIQKLTTAMLDEEQQLLIQRQSKYDNQTKFTPFAFLIVIVLSLLIFIFSFLKAYTDLKKLTETQAFLNKIIESSDYTISYFTPIYGKGSREIIDFRNQFTTENIYNIIDRKADEILHKKISEVYPVLFENGVFEIWKNVAEEKGATEDYVRKFNFNEQTFWFQNTATELDHGIVVTSKDITKLKGSEQKIKEAHDQLTLQNTLLRDAEKIAKISSFRFDIQEHKWSFSENIYNLLEIEDSEQNQFENGILNRIHKNDQEQFSKLFSTKQKSQKFTAELIRFITDKGNLKYFTLTGNSINIGERSFIVGVLQDETRSIQNERSLERKNLELEQSNTELESFNRIASHDLQEPLRKIQMFISRLDDRDKDNLSDTGKSYLSKILNSSERMQRLIKYLLSYSRINRRDLEMETFSLNKILKETLELFAEALKESEAELTTAELPVINGIPFQMQQLFNNLISNSIKYKKKNVPLKIEVDYSRILAREINLQDFKPRYPEYYKIEFKDNGIGFGPEHADKIFELFQRLHANEENLKGSGIGLAICRKILDVHQGYIMAKSIPGEGANFIIYLPITSM